MLRMELKPEGAAEGVFWMSFQDVLKYFDTIDICKVRTNWSECRITGVFPSNSYDTKHMTATILTVVETTEFELGLNQTGVRSQEQKNRHRLDLCVAVFTYNGHYLGKLVAHSKRSVAGYVGCQEVLEPGVYIIISMAFNHFNSDIVIYF